MQPAAGWATADARQPPGSRVLPRILGIVGALVLTPIALLLLTYGGWRVAAGFATVRGGGRDPLGIGLVVAGCVLLLCVALLGWASGLGPILAGLVYGLLPSLGYLIDPRLVFRALFRTVGRASVPAGNALFTYVATGALAAIGVALVGAGAAASLTRMTARRR
jgi:hypothetical protein